MNLFTIYSRNGESKHLDDSRRPPSLPAVVRFLIRVSGEYLRDAAYKRDPITASHVRIMSRFVTVQAVNAVNSVQMQYNLSLPYRHLIHFNLERSANHSNHSIARKYISLYNQNFISARDIAFIVPLSNLSVEFATFHRSLFETEMPRFRVHMNIACLNAGFINDVIYWSERMEMKQEYYGSNFTKHF